MADIKCFIFGSGIGTKPFSLTLNSGVPALMITELVLGLSSEKDLPLTSPFKSDCFCRVLNLMLV
jgi:hypothetical protein